ncbi:MAG: DUF2889 domain-containing protein [Betaproteobacteria bacterium]|nr:DUF2889 domain-containing protein [Betaproteobacteria bacterium]
MPLPEPAPRKLSHTRTLSLQGYERADGLWDIEGHIVDVKPHHFSLHGCVREAGEPIHEMRVRVTIDREMSIHAAAASSEAIPYRGHCDSTLPDYGKLVGLNLGRGFRRAVLERMGGVKGCTHITEMLTQLPSAAFQLLSAQPHLYDAAKANFAVGRCVGLRAGGEMVKLHYPEWYANVDKNMDGAAGQTADKPQS